MNFTLDIQCAKPQGECLANTHNKKNLTTLVCEKMKIAGINILTVQDNADKHIVTTDISKAQSDFRVHVFRAETDLLILMTALMATAKNPFDLFFHKLHIS